VSVHEIVLDDGGMNLLSSGALAALSREVAQLRSAAARPRDRETAQRILVLRSGRPNVFAAGADMNEMAQFNAGAARHFSQLGQETFAAIERLPMITVCVVDGDCFGGALDLALAFDLRFASALSRFSHPGAKLGIVTGFGGTSRWRSVLAPPAARRVLLGNPVLSAGEAMSIGVVDAIGEPDLESLSSLDVRAFKELSRRSGRLTQTQLALLSDRLHRLYDAGR
jgi:enoyl-CoA hydratase